MTETCAKNSQSSRRLESRSSSSLTGFQAKHQLSWDFN